MTEQQPQTRHLATDEEVQAVSPRTVLRVRDGSIVCRFDEQHGVIFGDDRPFPWTACRAPAVVLWADGDPTAPPAAPSTSPEPQSRIAQRRIDDALRIATSLAETLESECPTDEGNDICHGHDLYEGRCALAYDLERLVSTLGGAR